MPDIYINLEYEPYKLLEEQLRAWEERETSHTTVDGYYHKSIAFKVGDIRFEFHGPNVKAREQEDELVDKVDHASYHVDFETDEEGRTVAILASNRDCPYCQIGAEL